jgi:hypothetical protein
MMPLTLFSNIDPNISLIIIQSKMVASCQIFFLSKKYEDI